MRQGEYGVGARVGRWTLVRAIGEGGSASVFEAHAKGDARAAIKLLSPGYAAEPTLRKRFTREAYIANQIEHPGVVRVIEDGSTDEGLPFVAMELLDGETLEARRERKGGRLPIDEVMWIADETLAVLAAAHAKGIVHRDVKPDNLVLTREGRIKLLDFGIARLQDTETTAMTRVGVVLGTLAYMAPEQARGSIAEIGVASDVWGVGATMFTLLSGRLLREEDGVSGLIDAGRRGVVSLATVAPDVHAALVAVVDAALSFDPKVRWPTANAMRRALHATHAEMKYRESRRPHGLDDTAPASSASYEQIRVRPSMQPPRISSRPPTLAPPAPPAMTAPRAPGWLLLGVGVVIGVILSMLVGALRG